MMTKADEFREMAVSFEEYARSAETEPERRDFLDMARTMRQATAKLEARAAAAQRPFKGLAHTTVLRAM
jgi:hypothetical protein